MDNRGLLKVRRLIGLPVLGCLVFMSLLVGLRVNQYSVGMYGTPIDESPLAGVDRPIRSDEWLVRLPWLLGQSTNDFAPVLRTAGLHDASITYDLPTRSFEAILKPHLLPYLLIDIERAIAAEWWIMFFGSGIAVYFLLLSLRVSRGIAAPLAVVVVSNPGMHWWTVNSSFTVMLYGCLGTTALIASWRTENEKRRLILGFVAGWLLSCATVILYPPFQIPVLGALGLILVLKFSESVRHEGWRLATIPVASSLLTFLLLVGWFIFENRTGLSALTNTVYPGSRRTTAGGESFSVLLGTPFDLNASRITSGSVNFTNQSENASSFLVAIPVLLLTCAGALRGIKTSNARLQLLLLGWFSLLLAWMMLPLPRLIGMITLLDRVPPERIRPVIILVAVLAFAIHISFHNELVNIRPRIAFSVLFFLATVWAGSHYVVNDINLSQSSVWVWSTLWVGSVALSLVGWKRVGLWSLALISVLTSLNINPIRASLEPIYDNNIARVVAEFDPSKNATWMTFSGTAQIRGVLVSTGARVDSAVSPFPDESFWRRFDPSGEYKSQWNRYGHVQFVVGQGETQISSPQNDVIRVTVDPCVDDSPIVSGTYFVESDAGLVPCGQVLKKIEFQGSTWYVLRKT